MIDLRAKLLAASTVLVTLGPASGCTGGPCGLTAGLEIYLDGGRPPLDGGVLTLCVNGACNAGMPVWNPSQDGWESGQFNLIGALPTTATGASFFMTPDGRATISAGIPEKQPPGDLFDIRFVDAQG